MSRTALQCHCGNCDNILAIETDVLSSKNKKLCPYCGMFLSDSSQRIIETSHTTLFQKASQLSKITLDIKEIDSVLNFLTLNQKVCISGMHTQKLIERLCVRAQLPHRYGGLETKVLLIDGGNSSDIYQCIDFAQQYGLDVKKTLEGIITIRAFTVYQLANTILNETQDIIRKYGIKILIITNLLNFFSNDPFLDVKEMKQVLRNVINSLEKIQDCLVVISLGMPNKLDAAVFEVFSKRIKTESKYNALSIKITENKKTNLIILRKDALDKIPIH